MLQTQAVTSPTEQAIIAAKEKYDHDFFNKFSFDSKQQSRLSQQALEEYLTDHPEEIAEISLAMVHQTYELNDIIPNIELIFFKMFTSPLSTKD